MISLNFSNGCAPVSMRPLMKNAGVPVTPANVRSIRPSGGLAPDLIDVVLGRVFARSAAKGTPLSWDLL